MTVIIKVRDVTKPTNLQNLHPLDADFVDQFRTEQEPKLIALQFAKKKTKKNY